MTRIIPASIWLKHAKRVKVEKLETTGYDYRNYRFFPYTFYIDVKTFDELLGDEVANLKSLDAKLADVIAILPTRPDRLVILDDEPKKENKFVPPEQPLLVPSVATKWYRRSLIAFYSDRAVSYHQDSNAWNGMIGLKVKGV